MCSGVTLTVVFLFAAWICLSKGRVHLGKSTFELGTTVSSVNVSVSYERCISSAAKHVDARARTWSITLNIYPYAINVLSFDATVVSASGWNQTAVTVNWKSYFDKMLNNGTYGAYKLHYQYLGQHITWNSSRTHCKSRKNWDLCNSTQICQNGTVLSIGTAWGDNWTPVLDQVGDWMQIGDDNSANPSRLCKLHTALYNNSIPSWGKISGTCGQWSSMYNPCFLKGHVFCCKPV